MILQVSNINKYFNDNHILKDVSFHMNEYDKTALVGINGSGKTTLIRIIMNELNKDSGTISLTRGVSVGYLPQNAIIDSDATIYEEVLKVKEALMSDEQTLRDMEKEMGLPISNFCDRNTTNINKAMIGFINYVVLPTFDLLSTLIWEAAEYRDHCKANLKKYQNNVKKEEREAKMNKKKK